MADWSIVSSRSVGSCTALICQCLPQQSCCLSSWPLQVALRALGFPVKKSEVHALIAQHGDAAGNISRAAWEQICSDSMRNRDAGEQLARSALVLWSQMRLPLPAEGLIWALQRSLQADTANDASAGRSNSLMSMRMAR